LSAGCRLRGRPHSLIRFHIVMRFSVPNRVCDSPFKGSWPSARSLLAIESVYLNQSLASSKAPSKSRRTVVDATLPLNERGKRLSNRLVLRRIPQHARPLGSRAAQHRSWNREKRTGYKVIRALLKDGVPTGEYEHFMTGFVVNAPSVWARPVGVAVAHDGALSSARTETARCGVSFVAAHRTRSWARSLWPNKKLRPPEVLSQQFAGIRQRVEHSLPISTNLLYKVTFRPGLMRSGAMN
jgi:hypothetical protein